MTAVAGTSLIDPKHIRSAWQGRGIGKLVLDAPR
jgi:hypothetical protein